MVAWRAVAGGHLMGLVAALAASALLGSSAQAQSARFDDALLPAIRRAATSLRGRAPDDIGVVLLQTFRMPVTGMSEGAGPDSATVPYPVFQIRRGNEWIMVDAGMDPRAIGGRPTFSFEDYSAVQRGLRASTVNLLTHEHNDHALGVFRGPYVEEIQRRTQLTSAQRQWMLEHPNDTLQKLDPAHADRFRIRDYDGILALAPGVVLINAPGHTGGSQMVYVRLRSGSEVILVGDVAWHSDNITRIAHKPESATAGFGGEDRAAVEAQLRWLRSVRDAGVGLAVSHDLASLEALLARGALSRGFTFPAATSSANHLYLWTASADTTAPDFLAVMDVDASSPRFGRIITTVPVPGRRNGPHHTEHELAPDRRLFANGFGSGQTFIFDLSDPAAPRLDGQFGDAGALRHPHSFLLMPNGNRLATYQMQHGESEHGPGGLVVLDPLGNVVRSSSAAGEGVHPGTRPYSGVIVPALNRIVTTTTDMHADSPASRTLQVWNRATLTLLHTIALPDGPGGLEEGMYTAEPRLLRDGRTVLVSTFNCGLYLLEGLDGPSPGGRLVASFPQKQGTNCAIPVVSGDHYLVTVPAWSAVVSLDISNPAQPREVSRVSFDTTDIPHWIAISPDQRRVVVTGYGSMRQRVELLRFDPATGSLTREAGFGVPGGPHGAVFGRP
jgi:glyoxylase-like metal-dependent hydrolase (beta-lactamase superfamily II)